MATLGIPQNTIAVLQKYNFTFQKKYGQNFLIDSHVLEKIMDAAEIGMDDCVVEIGPGIGTMTQYLAESARHVIAVEIDQNLIPILKDTLSAYENVTVINNDILKVDIQALAQEYNGGRLPFYHFDVYRIGDVTEMDEIGYEEYFFSDGVCLVEWGHLIAELLPQETIMITIEKVLDKGFDYRKITVRGLN